MYNEAMEQMPEGKNEFTLSKEQYKEELRYGEAMKELTGEFPMPRAYRELVLEYEKAYGRYIRYNITPQEAEEVIKARDNRNREYLESRGIKTPPRRKPVDSSL
jgi:hypothetical protein